MKTVTLSTPIQHGDKTYTELTFDEPTVGDLAAGDSFTGDTKKMIAILASMTGVPIQALMKIKAREFAKLAAQMDLGGNGETDTTGDS